LGARYSALDASDFVALTNTDVTERPTGFTRAKAYTVGLKFLPNMNARFMLDYVNSDFENPVTGGGNAFLLVNGKRETQEKAILFRTQFMF
jgi:phosphate-selective porin OprO/OprP